MQGPALNKKIADCTVRSATESDIDACNRVCQKVHGHDRGGERAAIILSLVHPCKLNDVDPRAWLADVLVRIADHKITELAQLLPWNRGRATRIAA